MRSFGNGVDPRVMIDDMSSDMMGYAEDRVKLVNSLMGKLKNKYTKSGQSYQELRSRYGNLMGQIDNVGSSLYIFSLQIMTTLRKLQH